MEYIIGSVQRGNASRLILKTKDKVHTDLSGRITLEQKKGNFIIRDTFSIIQKYQTADSTDGFAYDWYYITDHFRNEDRSDAIRTELEQEITELEIETIEQDQELTDHDIAIMELQETLDGLMAE